MVSFFFSEGYCIGLLKPDVCVCFHDVVLFSFPQLPPVVPQVDRLFLPLFFSEGPGRSACFFFFRMSPILSACGPQWGPGRLFTFDPPSLFLASPSARVGSVVCIEVPTISPERGTPFEFFQHRGGLRFRLPDRHPKCQRNITNHPCNPPPPPPPLPRDSDSPN